MRILKLWLLLHAVHIIQMLELLWLNQSVAFITCHLLLTNCKTILLSDLRRCYRRAVQCLDSSGWQYACSGWLIIIVQLIYAMPKSLDSNCHWWRGWVDITDVTGQFACILWIEAASCDELWSVNSENMYSSSCRSWPLCARSNRVSCDDSQGA